MKKAFLYTSLLSALTQLACAEDHAPNPNRIDYLDAMVNDLRKQVADLKTASQQTQLNPSANPAVNSSCDAFITGDLLYWKASENGLGYVLQAKIKDPITLLPGNGQIINPNFGWDLGFRVGLGWNTNHDDWDLYFTWTRIHTAAHSHRHSEPRALFPTFAGSAFASLSCEKASSHLTVHLNVLDLEMGRNFYVGKHLSIRPHAGFENLWISQHYNTSYDGVSGEPSAFDHIRFRNNFWGFGIRSGVDSQWDLRWGLSIYSDIAFALLYGDFDFKRTTKNRLSNHHDKSNIDEKLTEARAAMEFNIGLRWETLFAHDRFHIALQAGWEEHIYFGQNQMFNFFDTAGLGRGKSVSSNDDLTFQGPTFSVRFDF